jgi:(p)ppGpp synthase/HD superfamily hydrolase
MFLTKSLTDADFLATKIHNLKLDYTNESYINHCYRVLQNVTKYTKLFKLTKEEIEICNVLALLHDTIEDSDNKFDTIQQILTIFKQNYLDILQILTHDKSELYKNYIIKIKKNKLATIVKLADLDDNMDKTRLINITSKNNLLRILKKQQLYLSSWLFLQNKITEDEYIA